MENIIRQNILHIREEIEPSKPNIIAVTKYFDENAIIAAYKAGLRDFAESRVIEAIEKISSLPDEIRENSKFHLIGHLQTNKVRKAVSAFDFIHSADSVKLAQMISQEALRIGKVQKVLLQLNNANEEQKFGFSVEELDKSFEQISGLKGIEIAGLMNMAPANASDSELEALFKDVMSTKNQIEKKYGFVLKEISMGMSRDYKIAACAGATMLRIGRKLFINGG
ncbi:MAG: YggS family pyridoxal phosphate-dependent enzyme [Heliobacteriaceae bacterium]|jgi:pyridoxal phosphate enzyme (YggS family)|nr:YggS family pyridoxal phosphate-dependent enzyme [Heliobacteriaceae bacterium]